MDAPSSRPSIREADYQLPLKQLDADSACAVHRHADFMRLS
jgi:hypothetical protein